MLPISWYGQAVAIAIKILLQLIVILAPNLSKERRIVPTVALAKEVLDKQWERYQVDSGTNLFASDNFSSGENNVSLNFVTGLSLDS
jgi:hypothetical protein